jgi:lysophospholipase
MLSPDAPLFLDVADAPPGGSAFWFHAADGARLRGAVWPGGTDGQRGSVILMPGRTEYIEKYGLVIGRLRARGLAVAVIDWRGQGLSDRDRREPRLGHVTDFALYQQDLDAFLATPQVAALPRPRLMLAHSMGGCIGLRALIRRLPFEAAILSAPMWGIRIDPAMRPLAMALFAAAPLIGLGRMFAPGTTAASYAVNEPFASNLLTTDPAAHDRFVHQLTQHPELALGGPSLGWLGAAHREMAALARMDMPALPVLAFAGLDEGIVELPPIRAHVGHMAQGRLIELPGARHEVLMESPSIQDRVWAGIDGFLDRLTA